MKHHHIRRIRTALLSTVLLGSGNALAQDGHFFATGLEAAYATYDGDIDADGFWIRGYGASHGTKQGESGVFMDFGARGLSSNEVNVNILDANFHFGWSYSVADDVALYGALGYDYRDISLPYPTDDLSGGGIGFRFGGTFQISPKAQLHTQFRQVDHGGDLSDADSFTGIRLGFQYLVGENWGVSGEYDQEDGDGGFVLGVFLGN